MASSLTWQASLLKLVSLIIILPFTATYFHLYHLTSWKNEYCFVGPHSVDLAPNNDNAVADNKIRGDKPTSKTGALSTDSIAQFYGIYAPAQQKKKKGNNDKRQFQQVHAMTTSTTLGNSSSKSWFWPRVGLLGGIISWPSITKASTMISSSQFNKNSNHVIKFIEGNKEKKKKKWCLQSTTITKDDNRNYNEWCSDPLVDEGIYSYPTSGVWKSTTSLSTSSSYLYISCPTPATTDTAAASNKKSKHKQQNAKQNANLQYILNHPTTALLLALNTYLAFIYWNHHVSPSSVCKQYTKIVEGHEWWRGLTGATAHFEPLHIGFNMMVSFYHYMMFELFLVSILCIHILIHKQL